MLHILPQAKHCITSRHSTATIVAHMRTALHIWVEVLLSWGASVDLAFLLLAPQKLECHAFVPMTECLAAGWELASLEKPALSRSLLLLLPFMSRAVTEPRPATCTISGLHTLTLWLQSIRHLLNSASKQRNHSILQPICGKLWQADLM